MILSCLPAIASVASAGHDSVECGVFIRSQPATKCVIRTDPDLSPLELSVKLVKKWSTLPLQLGGRGSEGEVVPCFPFHDIQRRADLGNRGWSSPKSKFRIPALQTVAQVQIAPDSSGQSPSELQIGPDSSCSCEGKTGPIWSYLDLSGAIWPKTTFSPQPAGQIGKETGNFPSRWGGTKGEAAFPPNQNSKFQNLKSPMTQSHPI
jgi:hypothetical protein